MQCTFKRNSMKVSLHSNDVSLWVIITKTNNHSISFYRSLEFPAGEKLLANYQVQNSIYNFTELLFIKLIFCSFWLRVINKSNGLNGLNVSQNLIHNDVTFGTGICPLFYIFWIIKYVVKNTPILFELCFNCVFIMCLYRLYDFGLRFDLQNPRESDALSRVQADVDETKVILVSLQASEQLSTVYMSMLSWSICNCITLNQNVFYP